MRILMLGVKEYPYGISAKYEKFPGGGTAKYVINLAEGLVKKGHEVHLIVRKFPGQKKYEKCDGIHIHRVKFINNKYLRLPSFNYLSYRYAKKLLKKEKFDIIHTHNLFATYFTRPLKQKIIATPHGLASTQNRFSYGKTAFWILKRLENKAFSKVNILIFESENEKENFFNIHKNLKIKNLVIPPAIKKLNLNGYKKQTKTFDVTFIGRIVPSKGLDNFISAFPLLPKKLQEKIRFVIVGDGYGKKDLEKLTKELGLESKIIFTGFTNKIKQYLANSDLYILPSRGGEGFPCALMEAMSLGKVCITTNFGLPINKKSICLLDSNSPKEITKKIEKMYKDNKLRKKIKNISKIEFRDKFSQNNAIKKHLECYKIIK